MQRQIRPDGLDTNVRSLRSPSISSDVMSNSARSIGSVVPHANPAPAYIAHAAASSLISSELDRTVSVAPSALTLVNEFLDHVLFTILTTSRSISLTSLRTAVPNVLKPRLGKAAVRVAEEELKEYLEDEEEAEYNLRKGAVDIRQDFDIELAWKWARLRCMVYTRLGDLEEEDEEEWLEREQLLDQVNVSGKPKRSDVEMGPASAIFLTTVIEYLGEQALYYAAQHAQRRHNLMGASGYKETEAAVATLTPKTDEIILDGKDMNHVGRDSPLSRLWRSWRRNTRETDSRPLSPDSALSPLTDSSAHSRSLSQGNAWPLITPSKKSTVNQVQSPRQIPLPMTDNDVEEIEVPGLASALSESEDEAPEVPHRSNRRPVSLVVMPGAFPDGADTPEQHLESHEVPIQTLAKPEFTRKRSMSTPAPVKGSLFDLKTNTKGIDERIVDPEEQDGANKAAEVPSGNSAVVHRRERSVADQGSVNKRAGMVGGAIAAAVGALGAGAAAAAAAIKGDDDKDRTDEDPGTPRRASTIAVTKRTVAEEMLGPGSSVSPPKDATTGASITNFADFDSMHIPVEMPPESPPPPELNAVQPLIEPMAPMVTERQAYAANRPEAVTTPSNLVDRSQAPHGFSGAKEQIQPIQSLPLRSIVPDQALRTGPIPPPLTKPISVSNNYRTIEPQSNSMATTTLLSAAAYEGSNSPVSPLPSTDSRTFTSDSDLSVTSDTTMPARQGVLASNPIRHEHTDSQASAYSNHSKSSSSSSRLLGFTRDAQGRPQTISQQRATGGMSEDTRAAHSSTPNSMSRDGHAGTVSSSPTKSTGKDFKQNDEISEAKKKSLEVLIQSNETLHYTLTPAAVMKDEDSYGSSNRRSETQDMADFIRNTGPPASKTYSAGRTPNSVVSPQTLESPSTNAQSSVPTQQRLGPSVHNTSQITSSPGRPPNPLGEPRGARAEKSTAIRDLADYARTTGPKNDSQLPKALSPRPPQTENLITTAPVVKPITSATPARKPTNRLKFQARDPRISKYAETADLIDFIREGPPRAPGEHRIDRKVAPFRTTMDSEDLNSLAPNIDQTSTAKTSVASTQDRRSEGPSVNSQTALLTHNKVSNSAAHGSRSTGARQPVAMDDDGMPQRTRTRVKDPYAIDYSDGEVSDDEERTIGESKRNEESLIDFLRNTAPPPAMAAQPILATRESNSQVLMPVQRANEVPQASGARESSPHLTQMGSKIDKYKPTQKTYAPHVERSRSKPKFEARDPTASRTETSELAEYLKNSGPPASAQSEPQPFVLSAKGSNVLHSAGTDKEVGIFRVFTKRKAR